MTTLRASALTAAAAAPIRSPLVLGAAVTLGAAYVTATSGALLGIGPLLAAGFLAALFAGFLVAPHVVVALVIPFFATLDSLRVFVHPGLGPVKDVIALTLAAAVATRVLQRRLARRPVEADAVVLVSIGLLIGLYLLNVGGNLDGLDFGPAWMHGVRLVAEPLLLLAAGLLVADARRTLRWAMASLLATATFVAAYGIAQQAIGFETLNALGYEYFTHIRWIGGQLRSFGTFDGPFAYAGFLLFGVAGILLWTRSRTVAFGAGSVVAAGLLLSFVRSAAVVTVALLGIWLARRRQMATAVLLLAAAVATAVAILATSSGATESRTIRGGPSLYLTLNGRTEVWAVALGDPWTWPLGRGVGVVGTAADRAEAGVVASASSGATDASAVDSGYFSTIADVGFVGLAILLVLFGRLLVLAVRASRAGSQAGWIALGLLAVSLLDALTRDSLTGFPTAFLGLLLIGLAIAAAREEGALEPRAPWRRETAAA